MKINFVSASSRKLVFFVRVLWVSFFTYLFNFFHVIGRHISRLQKKFFTRKESINLELIHARDDRIDNNLIDDEEETKSLLKFHFPTFEEFVQNHDVHSINDQVCSENTNDMITKPSEDIGNISNIFSDACEVITTDENEFSLELDGVEENLEEIKIENWEIRSQEDDSSMNNVHQFRREMTDVVSDDDESSMVSDSDSDSMLCRSNSSFRSSLVDSVSDGFLSDIDFERAFEVDTLMKFGPEELQRTSEDLVTEEDIELEKLSKGYGSDEFRDEDEDIMQELKKLESNLNDNTTTETLESNKVEMNTDSELHGESNAHKLGTEKETKIKNDHQNKELNSGEVNDALGTEDGAKSESEVQSKQNSEKSSSGEQTSSDSEEQNELEREWEHQDLVEQLKMEIKKVRAIGLPTILEESESPKIMEDLKPWKIGEKYQHEGTLDELHKFYKCYKEKMRKLDILNYQKMYAIGFLKLKDPLKSFTKNKTTAPALAAIVSVDCWPCKPKSSSEIHQPVIKKFSRELESDLETVYVGQMCLSWEFLCWEYSKALELWELDPHGIRHYNRVVEKFQTFQVIITRFLEDEPFQGPRVQHYVKTRCVLRSLLQVPLIRDDYDMNRKKERKVVSDKDAVTSLQLVEVIEKSIRTLWQFIRSDNDTSNVVLVNCRRSYDVELLNPADAKLLAQVRSSLHKKYKKLKELRSENCIINNLQKCNQETVSDQSVSFFFARVKLKLVSRVLNMSRISTEQLVWCNDTLKNINFLRKKLRVEPSILLFPCS